MRGKSLVLLAIALGCGMVAAVAVSKTIMDRDAKPAGEAHVEILVAVREIKTASQLSADKVKLEKWPKSRIPQGAITKIEQIEGKFASQGIFPGEPIIEPKVADSNSSLSTQIPVGHTLFNIIFDNNYIKPGDFVDVSGIFDIGKNKKQKEIRTVVSKVQVFAINGNSSREVENKGGKNTVFQLLIKQSQSQALMLANSIGRLELNLRPLGGDGELKEGEDDGDSFISWARENNADPSAEGEESQENEPAPSLVAAPAKPEPVPPDENKSEILIITPGGVTRYQYSGNEVPREVKDDPKPAVSAPPTNPWGSYSGYGGYSPTYPNTTPGTPGTGAPGTATQQVPQGTQAQAPETNKKPEKASPLID